ncbi:hypothetical protein D9611_002977 [Ephemerocybe angulata]|uniref:Uncharacterized protein n=1 Tax=Ephemerocybe angulata TaxID=980116 RepID=A0A8H5CB51_9AGAR|nr:hypothetical protein D9611_002977 [Tulosesus angulatus]
MSSVIESLRSQVIQHLNRTDAAAAAILVVLLSSYLLRRSSSSGIKTTNIAGPKGSNPIIGLSLALVKSENPAATVETWAKEFGPVFSLPMGFGRTGLILADVKAAVHFLARDTGVYHQKVTLASQSPGKKYVGVLREEGFDTSLAFILETQLVVRDNFGHILRFSKPSRLAE